MSIKEEVKQHISELSEEAKVFFDSNMKYYELLAFKISSRAISLVLKVFALCLVLSLTLIFFSFAVAYALGSQLDNYSLGFLIVGGFYVLVALLVYVLRKTIIETPVFRKLLEIFK